MPLISTISTLTINTEQVIEDTKQLVKIDSQNPGPQEGACVEWLGSRLQGMGVDLTIQSVEPGRDNLIAVIPGRSEGPRLVLSAHTDVVPVGDGWTKPAFDALVQDGKLYGRGSADMKSGLAVGLGVIEALTKSGPPASDVVLALTVDEEAPHMKGVHKLVEEGFIQDTDQVVALEPTGLFLRIAHVGLRWMNVTTHGRMAHAGRAHLGVDANHMMAEAICTLKTKVAALPYEDPLLGNVRFTCGMVSGGVATNVVPGRCDAQFDLRLVPPMTKDEVENLVQDTFAEVLAGFAEAEYQGAFEIGGLGVARPPIRAADDAKIVTGLQAAYQQVTGNPLHSGGADGHEAYTDAAMIAALNGSASCVAFGPGSSDIAHTADEFVPLSDIDTACRVMEALVKAW
jgi:succinyl-diaminopimelate desuccinylase